MLLKVGSFRRTPSPEIGVDHGRVLAVVRVHEDVGAALQLGVDAARRLELEAAGTSAGRGAAFGP